jgi:tRNA-dihydrouridine synthase A
LMADWDARYFGAPPRDISRDSVELEMVRYMELVADRGEPWSRVARHMLGLRHGQPGARHWRQVWSDHHHKATAPQQVRELARRAEPTAETT